MCIYYIINISMEPNHSIAPELNPRRQKYRIGDYSVPKPPANMENHPKPNIERNRERDRENLRGVQIAARNSLPQNRRLEDWGWREPVRSVLSKRGENRMQKNTKNILSMVEGQGPQISEWLAPASEPAPELNPRRQKYRIGDYSVPKPPANMENNTRYSGKGVGRRDPPSGRGGRKSKKSRKSRKSKKSRKSRKSKKSRKSRK
jgi:hypothetical protein